MTAINYKQKLETIVTELAQLRLTRERADAVFLLRLREVEEQHMGLLKSNGLESFEGFLKSYKLCDPARYRNFTSGLAKLGPDAALSIGADATVEAARLQNGKPTATKYVTAIEAWRDQHRGVAPTRETAAKILRQVDPREEEPQAIRNVTRGDAQARTIAKLENEVADLRAKLAKTEKERDAALKRCADLSKQLSAAKKR
jgi:hypothetical protein